MPPTLLSDVQRALVAKVSEASTGKNNNAQKLVLAVKARKMITTKEGFYLAIVAWRYRQQYQLTEEEDAYIKAKFDGMGLRLSDHAQRRVGPGRERSTIPARQKSLFAEVAIDANPLEVVKPLIQAVGCKSQERREAVRV